jgi:hypothetical protein
LLEKHVAEKRKQDSHIQLLKGELEVLKTYPDDASVLAPAFMRRELLNSWGKKALYIVCAFWNKHFGRTSTLADHDC